MSYIQNKENRFLDVLIYYLKRPLHGWLVKTLVFAGVTILSAPWWQVIVESLLQEHFTIEVPSSSFTVGIGLIIAGLFVHILEKIFPKEELSSRVIDVPKKTMRLIQEHRSNATWWHMGNSNKKPAMQIVGDFLVTNITDFNLLVVGVELKKPFAKGHICVRHHDENIYGNYHIEPGATTNSRFDFWIIPPFDQVGSNIKLDVAFLDQFGNKHWVKGVEFSYH